MIVEGREEEQNKITSYIKNYIADGEGLSLYVCGVPGSGKTYTVLKVIESIKINKVYINCTLLKKKKLIFQTIYNGLLKNKCLKETSVLKKNSNDIIYYENIILHLKNCKSRHLVVIDEIDLLISRNSDILYNLFDLAASSLMLIVIANNLPEKDGKVSSRLGTNRIYFKPYSVSELVKIFNLEKDDPFILACKRISAVNGDIRKLQNIKEMLKNNTFTEVNKKIKEMYSPLHLFFLKALTPKQKTVIKILCNKRKMDKLKCYEEFKAIERLENTDINLIFYNFEIIVNTLVEYKIIKYTHNKTVINLQLLNEEVVDYI